MLAHEAVAGHLVERLAGATEVLRVGQADDFATEVPPVIEREAQERVRALGEQAGPAGRGSPGRPAACRTAAGSWRPRWPPTSIRPPVLGTEVFGPLVTVEAVASVEAACDVVESLPFALTGGLFSRSPGWCARSRPLAGWATCT